MIAIGEGMQTASDLCVEGVPYLVLQPPRRVVFATTSGVLASREGPSAFDPGDAIVADALGQWVVRQAVFERTYEPVPGQATGADGSYRKKRSDPVRGRRLSADAALERPGEAPLHGRAGDWIVWPERRLAEARFVAHEAFAENYALQTVPVFVEICETLWPGERTRVRSAAEKLMTIVPHTPIVCIGMVGPRSAFAPRPWLRVTRRADARAAGDTPTVGARAFEERLGASLQKATRDPTLLAFSWRRLRTALGMAPRSGAVDLFAAQLAAVDHFNQRIVEGLDASDYLRRCDHTVPGEEPDPAKAGPIPEPAGLERVWRIGAVADHWAGKYQVQWQETVFATTSDIAALASQGFARRAAGLLRLLSRPTLVSSGLVATFAFATFGEWSGGCDAERWFAWTRCDTHAWSAGWEPLMFLVYVCALLFAWARFARAKIERFESRHQDFRLLAECMRSRYIGTLLRIRRCVTAYLDEEPDGEARWVHAALRSIHDTQPVVLPDGAADLALARAQHDFVHDQKVYHALKLLRRRIGAKAVLVGYGRFGFLAFLAAAILMGYQQGAEAFHGPAFDQWVTHLLLSAMVVSLAFWGAMRKVIDVHGLEAEVQRGERVLRSLEEAAAAPDGRRETIEALRVFIQDQSRWHRLHRDKPIEAATGA